MPDPTAPIPRHFSAGGPSEAALDAALKRVHYAPAHAEKALDAAHDPALELDRSVCLRDIVNFLDTTSRDPVSAREIAREFGGGR